MGSENKGLTKGQERGNEIGLSESGGWHAYSLKCKGRLPRLAGREGKRILSWNWKNRWCPMSLRLLDPGLSDELKSLGDNALVKKLVKGRSKERWGRKGVFFSAAGGTEAHNRKSKGRDREIFIEKSLSVVRGAAGRTCGGQLGPCSARRGKRRVSYAQSFHTKNLAYFEKC